MYMSESFKRKKGFDRSDCSMMWSHGCKMHVQSHEVPWCMETSCSHDRKHDNHYWWLTDTGDQWCCMKNNSTIIYVIKHWPVTLRFTGAQLLCSVCQRLIETHTWLEASYKPDVAIFTCTKQTLKNRKDEEELQQKAVGGIDFFWWFLQMCCLSVSRILSTSSLMALSVSTEPGSERRKRSLRRSLKHPLWLTNKTLYFLLLVP